MLTKDDIKEAKRDCIFINEPYYEHDICDWAEIIMKHSENLIGLSIFYSKIGLDSCFDCHKLNNLSTLVKVRLP